MSFGGEIKKGDRLSPREEEVYRYLACGLMNKQIAHELGIGEATVKALVSAVLRKIGATCRSQAAIMYHGLSVSAELERARAAMIERNPPPLALPVPPLALPAPAAGVEA